MSSDMKEEKIQIFVDITKNYFQQFSSEELIVETPYLSEGVEPRVYDFTGVIGISGVMRGVVYVTATRDLLNVVLQDMNEDDANESMLVDLVGEIANTIAGNARKEFGADFHISIPFVFKGAPQSVILSKENRAFIIPIIWRQKVGEIVVYLENN